MKPGPKLQQQYPCCDSSCNIIFQTSQQRANHESKMRTQGRGHEKRRVYSIAGSSKAGSQIGQEDQKMDDFNANKMMPPENIMRSSIGPKSILTSANPFGFVTGETDAQKLAGLKKLATKKDAPAVDKKADPRAISP